MRALDDAPWIEKFRPRNLRDVVGNKETVERLQIIAEEGNCPNILIAGPPGTGKTTSILCLCHQMLGDAFKEAVLELNASDERGIDVVRNKIKGFAQKKVTLPPGRHKIIILDEADSMTPSAQQALRRTMELYSNTTRFALACNVSSKIIEPIQSRCAILRFSRLAESEILTRLKQVCEMEEVTYSDTGLAAILFTSEGDMRNALNSLQATNSGFGCITEENVYKVCDQPHPAIVQEIIEACMNQDLDKALQKLAGLYNEGYAAIDLIGTLFKVTKGYKMPEKQKLEYIKEIGTTHMRITDGVASLLQLSGLCARMCNVK